MVFITVSYDHLKHNNILIFTYKKAGEYNYLSFTTRNRESLRDLPKVVQDVCSKTGSVTHFQRMRFHTALQQEQADS